MTATRDIETFHDLPEHVKSAIMALSILIDRVGGLPKPDRDDLFELLQEWRRVESDEERRSIRRAMDEILSQIPVRAQPLQPEPKNPKTPDPWSSHVGMRIRELRAAAGFNQTQLNWRNART